ncbi:rRNA-processing protein [Lachnellula occidentalis]|uniref:rRNA-processing protein n=1 Tax=Lachnellula occidentalis TaxID=215460 RepID=A0A8H8RWR2_9HELO|nr:rRNA-processing protein [Lachnellula occidentalis]
MGTAKRTRKFGAVKRVIGQNHAALKKNQSKGEEESKKQEKGNEIVREIPQVSSALFFQYNQALVPPYSVLVDTELLCRHADERMQNFLSHTVQRKLPLLESLMDTFYAKCIPIITSCVMAELEKLGPRYRIALRIARDERWERLQCDHKGTYADDCIVDRVMKSRIYIVATNDRDLKRRVRKIPGVPIVTVGRGKYTVERLPDAPEK